MPVFTGRVALIGSCANTGWWTNYSNIGNEPKPAGDHEKSEAFFAHGFVLLKALIFSNIK